MHLHFTLSFMLFLLFFTSIPPLFIAIPVLGLLVSDILGDKVALALSSFGLVVLKFCLSKSLI
jgi:hypothetical protein